MPNDLMQNNYISYLYSTRRSSPVQSAVVVVVCSVARLVVVVIVFLVLVSERVSTRAAIVELVLLWKRLGRSFHD